MGPTPLSTPITNSYQNIMLDVEKDRLHSKSTKLNGNNYNIWVVATQGELMSVNAWQIVNGSFEQPADPKEHVSWIQKREEAAGVILKSLEPSQYVHVKN